MEFIHKFMWLLMQIKELNIPFVCILSYFKCISIIYVILGYDLKIYY